MKMSLPLNLKSLLKKQKQDLIDIKIQLDKMDEAMFNFDPGETIIDENNVVHITDAQGRMRLMMARSDYDKIIEAVEKSKNNVTPA